MTRIALAVSVVATLMSPVHAQKSAAPDAGTIRSLVARIANGQMKDVAMLKGHAVLLDTRPLAISTTGMPLRGAQGAEQHTNDEFAVLAGHLGGRVATESEHVRCAARSPGGPCVFPETNNALVRIGEPVVTGDSAQIMFSISVTTGKGDAARPVASIYRATLARTGATWKVRTLQQFSGGAFSAPISFTKPE